MYYTIGEGGKKIFCFRECARMFWSLEFIGQLKKIKLSMQWRH